MIPAGLMLVAAGGAAIAIGVHSLWYGWQAEKARRSQETEWDACRLRRLEVL